MTGSWKGRGNQYIQFVRVLYCKLPTNGKQLPAFPLEAVSGIEPRPQRWEARVLPLCHRGPVKDLKNSVKTVLEYIAVNIYQTLFFFFFFAFNKKQQSRIIQSILYCMKPKYKFTMTDSKVKSIMTNTCLQLQQQHLSSK